jgi:hypothetical protein
MPRHGVLLSGRWPVGPHACLFIGQAEGDPVERVAGTVECNLGTTLDPLILTGTWEMTS